MKLVKKNREKFYISGKIVIFELWEFKTKLNSRNNFVVENDLFSVEFISWMTKYCTTSFSHHFFDVSPNQEKFSKKQRKIRKKTTFKKWKKKFFGNIGQEFLDNMKKHVGYEKSKFWLKIDVFVENRNFRRKSKFSSMFKFWVKIEIFVKNRNFGQKSKFWFISKFCCNIQILLKNPIFCQTSQSKIAVKNCQKSQYRKGSN